MASVSTAENQCVESVVTPEKQSMVTSFPEIAVGQSVETAKHFLQVPNWKLEEAIQLPFEDGASTSSSAPPEKSSPPLADQSPGEKSISSSGKDNGSEEVWVPLPVKRDVMYDDPLLYRAARMKRPGVLDPDQGATSTKDNPHDNIGSLYRPPFTLIYRGPFDEIKQVAAGQDKWLVVNLQSTKEFSSHMLNRDIWANELVAQIISNNFIFWQEYDDTTEGKKVCTYYNLVSIPVVLVLDPITGQKMRMWSGMMQPEHLLEGLLPFMDGGPKDHHVALPHKQPRETSQPPTVGPNASTAHMEEKGKDHVAKSLDATNRAKTEAETSSSKKAAYPDLPEEPKVDKELLCRVGVRLPDGRRFQRDFLRTDPIQLLWSYCSFLLDAKLRSFHLTHAIPGASKILDYEANLTFDESGLSNSKISVTWE